MNLLRHPSGKSLGIMALLMSFWIMPGMVPNALAQAQPPSEPMQLPGFQTMTAPVGGAAESVSPPPGAKPAGKPARKKPVETTNKAPTSSAETAQVSGRYAILRDGGKDTSCMLTLDDKSGGPSHSYKAVLSPACRDQGIVIFDPAGWEVDGDNLLLIARKGHENHFVRQPDRSWVKDAREGKPLILKKL